MEKGSEKRPPASQSFLSPFESSGKRQNMRAASPLGRTSVAELVGRYQDIFDCENASSADEKSKIREKRFFKKVEQNASGLDVVIFQRSNYNVSKSKSMESLAVWQVSPSTANNNKSDFQARIDSRKAITSSSSSPSLMEFLNKTSATNQSRKSQFKAGNMDAMHYQYVKVKPQTDPLDFSFNSNRRRGQENSVTSLPGNILVRKEAQLARRNPEAPSRVCVSVDTSRKVNNYERTSGVLGHSDNRRHIPSQGHRLPSSPSVKERSALYLSRAAAAADHASGLPELGGAKEECALCSVPVYPMERMAIQNILLHRTCFCCKHCGRKLSLLSYTIFDGAFYCKVHHKLLSEKKQTSQEENNSIPQKYQQRAKQTSPRLASKSGNEQTGKLLMREKMQPRLCGSQSQASLKLYRQTRQLGCETASWNKPQPHWPPLNEEDTGMKSETPKKLQHPTMILHNQNRTERNPHKALKDGSKIAADALTEKKQSHLLTAVFPKSTEAALFHTKIVGGNREPGVLEKRQFFMDERIFRAQARKEGQSILEMPTSFHHSQQKLKRSISVASPSSAIPPAKPFSVRLFPSHSEPLRTKKVTNFGTIGVPGASLVSKLSKSPFEGKMLSRSSSSQCDSDGRNGKQFLKRVKPLPKTMVTLAGLVPPKCRHKTLLEANKSNTLVTLDLEGAEQSNHDKAEAIGGHNLAQAIPEASEYLSEHKDEESHKIEHGGKILTSCLDSVNTHLEVNQVNEQTWIGKSEFPREQVQVLYQTSLQRSENEKQKDQHEKVDVKTKKDMQQGRKSDSILTLNCVYDQASQDTGPEQIEFFSGTEVEMGNGHSIFSSQADDPENMMFLPKGNLQDISWTHNVTLSAHENQEPVNISRTDGELPRETNNENNILQPQEDRPGGPVLHASTPQSKEPETLNSCEAMYLIENQVMGNVDVELKPQNGGVSTVQVFHNNGTTDAAGQQPLKNEKNPSAWLCESKIKGSAPTHKPARTKKASKTQSAFATLFGYSFGKDKNPKERSGKASAKPLVEASNEGWLEDTCSSDLSRLCFSKEEEVSEVATQKMSLDVDLQASEGSCGSCPKDGQRETSPPMDNAKGLNANTVLGLDVCSSSVKSPVTMNPEVTKQSKTLPGDHSDSSLFTKFQNTLATKDNILQCPASSSVKINSKMNADSRGTLDDQGLSNLSLLNYQDLGVKSEGVSLLNPSSEDEVQVLDQDCRVPDMLLFSIAVEESASMQVRKPPATPHLDTRTGPVVDESSHDLNSSENLSQINSPHQLPELGTPLWVNDDELNHKDPPESGNSEMFHYGDPECWHQFSSDNTIGLDFQDEQANADSSPTGRDQFSPLLAPLQHIPELLRDTINAKVDDTTERASHDLKQAEESNHLPASTS